MGRSGKWWLWGGCREKKNNKFKRDSDWEEQQALRWQVEVMKECGVLSFECNLNKEKRKRIWGSAVKFSICRATLSHFLNSEESIQPTTLLSATHSNRKPVQEYFQGSSLCSLLTSSHPYPQGSELFQLPSVNPHIKCFQDTRMSSFITFSLLALARSLFKLY